MPANPSAPTPSSPAAGAPAPPRSRLDRILAAVERGGNALPHPATLFAILALLVVLASWLAAQAGLAVISAY